MPDNPTLDVSGYDAITEAIRTLLNQYPLLGTRSILFATLDKDGGIAFYPSGGGIVENTEIDITGFCRQKCQYPFTVVYRSALQTEARRQTGKEWLDNLGRWLEQQTITIGETFKKLEKENEGIVKSGRTHLQDAVPISFDQEISGWRTSLERDIEMLKSSLPYLRQLALGGTAVGTGLNAPKGFDSKVAEAVSKLTGKDFITAPNKYHALTSKDELVFAHGAIKALACDMMKIANDVRWLASGPRDGLGEIHIPEKWKNN